MAQFFHLWVSMFFIRLNLFLSALVLFSVNGAASSCKGELEALTRLKRYPAVYLQNLSPKHFNDLSFSSAQATQVVLKSRGIETEIVKSSQGDRKPLVLRYKPTPSSPNDHPQKLSLDHVFEELNLARSKLCKTPELCARIPLPTIIFEPMLNSSHPISEAHFDSWSNEIHLGLDHILYDTQIEADGTLEHEKVHALLYLNRIAGGDDPYGFTIYKEDLLEETQGSFIGEEIPAFVRESQLTGDFQAAEILRSMTSLSLEFVERALKLLATGDRGFFQFEFGSKTGLRKVNIFLPTGANTTDILSIYLNSPIVKSKASSSIDVVGEAIFNKLKRTQVVLQEDLGKLWRSSTVVKSSLN